MRTFVRAVGSLSALAMGSLVLLAGPATASPPRVVSGSAVAPRTSGGEAEAATPITVTTSTSASTATTTPTPPTTTTTTGANAPGRGHLIIVIATVAVGVGFLTFAIASARSPHQTDSSP